MIHEIRAADQPGGTVTYRYKHGQEHEIAQCVIADLKDGLLDVPAAIFVLNSVSVLRKRWEQVCRK